MKHDDWQKPPSDQRHRIGIGRFKWTVINLFLAESLILFISIQFNEVLYFIGGAIGLLLVYFIWVRKRRELDSQVNQEAVQLLTNGQFAQAALRFDEICTRPNNGSTLAIFLMNRATASLCMGKFEFALQIYHEVLRAERGVARSIFRRQGDVLRARVAEALACFGKLDEAEALLNISTTHDTPARCGIQLLGRTVIKLRRGEHQSALEHLMKSWPQAEEVYRAAELKALITIRGFALSQVADEGRVQQDAVVATLSCDDVLRSCWMGTHWPEMRKFLDQLKHKLRYYFH